MTQPDPAEQLINSALPELTILTLTDDLLAAQSDLLFKAAHLLKTAAGAEDLIRIAVVQHEIQARQTFLAGQLGRLLHKYRAGQ